MRTIRNYKMLNATLSEQKPGYLRLQGPVSFANAPVLLQQGQTLMAQHAAVTINFDGVTTSNSAGLALLTGWWRTAKQTNKSIHFINIPTDLAAIASVCGVDHLLATTNA